MKNKYLIAFIMFFLILFGVYNWTILIPNEEAAKDEFTEKSNLYYHYHEHERGLIESISFFEEDSQPKTDSLLVEPYFDVNEITAIQLK